MAKRYKVGFNEDLNSILNYIWTSDKPIFLKDLIQFCVDYDYFVQLYMNYPMIRDCINEKNSQFRLNK